VPVRFAQEAPHCLEAAPDVIARLGPPDDKPELKAFGHRKPALSDSLTHVPFTAAINQHPKRASIMISSAHAPVLGSSHPVRKRLIVEGWRFLPHSYAIVNQWQLLALRRRNVNVKVVDVPFYRAAWQAQTGIFDPAAEQTLRSFEVAHPDDSADVTFRIFAPFTFLPSRSHRTAVFATLEQQLLQKNQMRDAAEYAALRQKSPSREITIVTPSRWSAEGFYKSGFDPAQVQVVPHGVDCAVFRPMPESHDSIRRESQIPESDFVFLSVGAMSGNKGVDLLLRSFAEIRRRYRDTRLILKGIDGLYDSHTLLLKTLRTLTSQEQELVLEKMTYIGESFSNPAMASLYQIAVAYV
jgi:glycosyltransferase involved in cell wall biosynthesis